VRSIGGTARAVFFGWLIATVQFGCSAESSSDRAPSPEELSDLTCEAATCPANETCIVEGDAIGCVCEGDFHRDAEETCVSNATLTSCTSEGIDCTESQPEGFVASCDPVEGCAYVCPEETCQIAETCVPAGSPDPTQPCKVCVPSISRTSYSALAGLACDDGEVCTFSDACDEAGECLGTPITCEDDEAVCGIKRACNGTSSCVETYTDEGTACDDNDLCTYGDACNGEGFCFGTGIECVSEIEPCGADRSCNGTSQCDVQFPGSDVACDDADLCTYSDVCNGGGTCMGTPVVCEDDPSICGAAASCNGTSVCSLEFTGPDVACDDGDLCTVGDTCDGSGACQSGGRVDCGPGGTCGIEGCQCLEGYTGEACRECDVGYVADGEECLPEASALPGFALVDVNSASGTFNETIRFEDYRGRISAWYFFHST
jgi:hypothetical protein